MSTIQHTNDHLINPIVHNTHLRNCLRGGYFISPCECKTTTDYEAQLLIGFGMRCKFGITNAFDVLVIDGECWAATNTLQWNAW